jgi:hypothetical protein
MINIKDLTGKDIGRWVVYRSSGGDKLERGKLKSWNDKYIFVVYNTGGNWDGDLWQDYTAASTRPEDLEFVK